MLTLDQLQVFLAVVEQGSFSAAARKLRRVQSAVSHAMANLEEELRVVLWDRSTRVPRLTEQGRVLAAAARRVRDEVDALTSLSASFATGLEAAIALSVDAVFPVAALVQLSRELGQAFPTVELRLYVDTMSDVATRVRDGSADVGVVGPAADIGGLSRVHVTYVRMVPVAAREHPLSASRGPIASRKLAEHVQIVLTERSDTRVPDQAVLSPRTFRVADLHTKHELLRGGLGWGNMPEHVVREDLRKKRLVRLRPEAFREDEHRLSLSLVHRPSLRMGPVTRWLIARLGELCAHEVAPT